MPVQVSSERLRAAARRLPENVAGNLREAAAQLHVSEQRYGVAEAFDTYTTAAAYQAYATAVGRGVPPAGAGGPAAPIVCVITNSTGTTTGVNTYDTYGKRTSHTGTTDSAIGYTAAWTDPTTGLIHLRARDYDPAGGQFLTIDPKIDTSLQAYAYAANNPLQNTDPAGLCADWSTSCSGWVPALATLRTSHRKP